MCGFFVINHLITCNVPWMCITMLQILSEWKDVLYFHPNIVCDCKGSVLYHEVSGCAEEDAMHLLIYLYIVYFYI